MALGRLARCLGLSAAGGTYRSCGTPRLAEQLVSLQQSAPWQWSQARFVQTGLPLDTGRPRLVVLGTGWAAARLARDIDTRLYDLTIISPRNHMVRTIHDQTCSHTQQLLCYRACTQLCLDKA